MRTYEQMQSDMRELQGHFSRAETRLLRRGQYRETLDLVERARANVECMRAFPDQAETFYSDASTLAMRAYLRINGSLPH
jgi:hypothetical protein